MYWLCGKNMNQLFPALSKLAVRYLGITTVSIPAESLFKGTRGSEKKTEQSKGEDSKYASIP